MGPEVVQFQVSGPIECLVTLVAFEDAFGSVSMHLTDVVLQVVLVL